MHCYSQSLSNNYASPPRHYVYAQQCLYAKIQQISNFFLISKPLKMQIQLKQLSFKVSANLLSDYILQKQSQLITMQQQFTRQFISQQNNQLHLWLVDYAKLLNSKVQELYDGARDYLQEMDIPFVFSFFKNCLGIVQQTGKYLMQALNQKINKSIDFVHTPIVPQTKVITVHGSTDKNQDINNSGKGVRFSKLTSKDLQSLDYFLNLLSYEDNKSYEQYKFLCDKLLMQRQSLQSIVPSQASRQIMETANNIEEVMQSTDRVFQDSYLIKYMEFKSYLNNLQKPQNICGLFKEEMEVATRERFREGMTRTLNKMAKLHRERMIKHMVCEGVQTEENSKNKIQDKLQNLLIQQKRSNQKLMLQIAKLKRNSSNSFEDRSQIQKKLQHQQLSNRQLQSKYKILQNMYNQKCNEMLKSTKRIANYPQNQQKRNMIANGTQTKQNIVTRSAVCQTDIDFYYYFQSSKIQQLQRQNEQLQKMISHKDYIIQEMQAIKTFRDNFKSKREIYSTIIKSHRSIPIPKSLHYLNQDDDIYDEKEEEKKGKASIDGCSTKKEVKFGASNNQIGSRIQLINRKKSKKRTEVIKNKPYFAFNDKIDNEDEMEDFIKSKSQCEQPHQISLKSILKFGNSSFKLQQGTQTEIALKDKQDAVIMSNLNSSRNQRNKIGSRDAIKDKSKENSVVKGGGVRPSQMSQISKTSRDRLQIQSNSKQARKSNFMSFDNMNALKKPDAMDLPMQPSVIKQRMSEFTSPLKKVPQKSLIFARLSKWGENKMNTVSNEVLHVNNSLNFNIFQPLSNPMRQTLGQSSFNKGPLNRTTKYQQMNKTTKLKRMV